MSAGCKESETYPPSEINALKVEISIMHVQCIVRICLLFELSSLFDYFTLLSLFTILYFVLSQCMYSTYSTLYILSHYVQEQLLYIIKT